MLLNDMIARNIQTHGRGLALHCHRRSHTWTEMGERIARLSTGFKSLGLKPGARIAILASNSDRYTECMFASAHAGAVFVPINTRLAPVEIVYWLADSGSELLCIDDDFLPLLDSLRTQLPALKHALYIGEQASAPQNLIGQDALIDAHPPGEAATGSADDLVGLFYTGGTTGKSKGVMLSHRNLIANSFNLLPLFGLDHSSRYLHAAPMFHIADNCGGFSSAITGAANFYVSKFDPVVVMQTIQEQKITHTIIVPTMINALVNHPRLREFDLSSLRCLAYGGSPMPSAVAQKTLEVLPHVRLLQCYGQTEAAPCLSFNTHESHIATGPHAGRIKSAGQSALGVQLRIFDVDGNEVPRGTVGEICARGDVIMQGYWNKPKQTSETLRDGWLHTGDSGTMDADGFVYIVDRVKDMIISGGENVYSVEVEEALYRHPAVAECAVIGIPDDKWGETVHAILRLKDGQALGMADVIEHCREHIAGFKCPRSVDFRAEPLPVSGAGKILKSELRKPFWAGQSRQVN